MITSIIAFAIESLRVKKQIDINFIIIDFMLSIYLIIPASSGTIVSPKTAWKQNFATRFSKFNF